MYASKNTNMIFLTLSMLQLTRLVSLSLLPVACGSPTKFLALVAVLFMQWFVVDMLLKMYFFKCVALKWNDYLLQC